MKWPRAVCCLLLLSIAGCAMLSDADRAYLQQRHVAPDVYHKMVNGETLSLGDIVELSRRHVPPGFIIHYLRGTNVAYRLNSQQVTRLLAVGVSREVIDYLLASPTLYGPMPYPFGYPWYPVVPYDGYFYGAGFGIYRAPYYYRHGHW